MSHELGALDAPAAGAFLPMTEGGLISVILKLVPSTFN